MSPQLDPDILAALNQEARECFLDEDAPEYLQTLEAGLQQRHQPDFNSLLRAAHSLKGGAGIAQLTSLQKLAHKLEDVLQALQQEKVEEVAVGWNLVEQSVAEAAFMLSQARTVQDVAVDAELISALSTFVADLGEGAERAEGEDDSVNDLLVNTLNQDLETCLAQVEELPADAPGELIQQCLENFYDECLFLGETLDLPWIVEAIAPVSTALDELSAEAALVIAKVAIEQIRNQREEYLNTKDSYLDNSDRSAWTEFNREPENLEESFFAPTDPDDIPTGISTFVPQPQVVTSQQQESETALPSQIRIPLARLNNMTNSVEELILTQTRMQLQQQQLQQANQRLRQLARQFDPLREQIQTLYGELAIGSTSFNPNKSSPTEQETTSAASSFDFDSLELDRYSDLHSSLQTFQELILQVQETRNDIELIQRDLAEDLEEVQKNLDQLYTNVTESRLVPFHLLAQRFIPQIRHLSQRYDKSVQLEIEGKDTLVDQLILEQLQTPLTHLLNNAFDHGIETLAERLAQQKSATACISLKASVNNNQLVITISDDGGGINLEKVHQQAVKQGICPPTTNIKQFSSAEIIDWIFQPDFSTASTVSDLSGRGMGLDIVRAQVQKLRGTIQVETQLYQGTTLILRFPLNLSRLSLFLVQVQNRLFAFPVNSVRASIPYGELEFSATEPPMVNWQQQTIPIMPLKSLLSCPRQPLESSQPKIGIVVETTFGLLMVTADALLSEAQLIVKPFDDTVVIPPYLAGCTILGTGEVVPVILPQGFELSMVQKPSSARISSSPTIKQTTTILVAEDSVATRRLLQKLLTAVGYQVIACRDGQEALEKLQQRQGEIDLVLSDIEMPRLNGFELLQRLKANQTWQQIPVVMSTSRTGDRHRQQAEQLGANDYLGKPVQPQELLTTIESLLT